jgi:mannose-6-phosphate isomerase-like protein (cupin superfamily)
METKDRGAEGAEGAGATERRSVAMPGARLVTVKVASEQTGGAYSLLEVEVGPGGGESPHVQHREDECLYVVEGRFAFAVEGEKTEGGPGEHVYVAKGALHSYENAGDGTGRLLALHTPGGPQERFVERAGRPAAGPGVFPRSSPEGLAPLAAEHGIEIC